MIRVYLNELYGKIFLRKPVEKNKHKKDEYYNFNLIEYYFRNKTPPDSFQVMNDQIMSDIDFDELFMFLDRTHSKVGQQYLYNQLLAVPAKINFEDQERLITTLMGNEEKCSKTQSLLSGLNKRTVYYICNLFLDKYIPEPKWYWLIKVASFAGLATLICSFFIPKMFLLLILVYAINTLIHFWNKDNILVYVDSIPHLPLLCNIAKALTTMDLLSGSKPSVLKSVASINELKFAIKVFKADSGIKSEIEALILFVVEMFKILLLIEPLLVFRVLRQLEIKKDDIQHLFEYVGKIDSILSVATIRQEAPYFCKPAIISTGHSLEFAELYHPLIADCVSNSLDVKDKSILLTGSNMSGKTTFIRSVTINVLLAQTINTCFAKEFRCSQTKILSAIRIFDDLLNDKSYYLEEVLTIKEMVKESRSGSNHLFFLDEIFKGTNTVERIAAGKAVLSYLADSPNNIVFVSTHDIELTDLLNEQFDLYHFTEVIQDGQIHFDYKLKEGNLSTRNAIRILEISDYPEKIVTDARNTVPKLQNVI